MPFTFRFPSTGSPPQLAQLADWLTEHGEPFEESPTGLALTAIPLRIDTDHTGHPVIHLHVTTDLPLSRLVGLLFELSMHLGADVELPGVGTVSRSQLWMLVADEQDRLRIAEALTRAEEQGKRDEVVRGLWAVLGCLRSSRDIRWDANKKIAVEMREVGDGISVHDAAPHALNPSPGDLVAVPVANEGELHILAWRWLSEAYPSLTTK